MAFRRFEKTENCWFSGAFRERRATVHVVAANGCESLLLTNDTYLTGPTTHRATRHDICLFRV